jgi:hypothetical protein
VVPVDLDFRDFVRRLACAVTLEHPPTGVDPCHRLAKRVNGDWLKTTVDAEVPEGYLGERTKVFVGNIFPALRRIHQAQHAEGVETFQRKHGIDLERVCQIVGAAYLAGWDADALAAEAMGGDRGYEGIDLSQPPGQGLAY